MLDPCYSQALEWVHLSRPVSALAGHVFALSPPLALCHSMSRQSLFKAILHCACKQRGKAGAGVSHCCTISGQAGSGCCSSARKQAVSGCNLDDLGLVTHRPALFSPCQTSVSPCKPAPRLHPPGHGKGTCCKIQDPCSRPHFQL